MPCPACNASDDLTEPVMPPGLRRGRRQAALSAIEFCIPTTGKAVPSGEIWFHEIKYDGCRLRIERDGKAVRLITRGGHD